MRNIFALIGILGLAGWIMNLNYVITVIVSNPATSSIDVLTIAKGIGIFFFPLGAILGYF